MAAERPGALPPGAAPPARGELARMRGAYAAFMRAHVRRILEYRASFFIGGVAVLTRHVVGVLTLWVLFTLVREIGGWSAYQVVYLYGFLALVQALHHFFFLNTFRLEYVVQDGTMDLYLVRPLPALFQLMFYYMDDDAIGDLVPALLLVAVASARLGVAYTPSTIAMLVMGVAGGVLIFFGIHLALASWSFWFVKSRALIQLFSEVRRFSEYPLTIFTPALQLFLTLIVPLAFAAYYPAARILNIGTLSFMAWLSLPVGFLCVAAGYLAWRLGLSRYQSTGS